MSTYSAPISISRSAQSGKRRVVVLDVGEPPRLEAVRREDRRVRQQQLADRVGHFVRREFVAAAGGEHRIEHQRHVGIVGEDLRDGGDALEASQHADLERVHRHVLEQAARLVGHPFGVHRQEPLDAARVLHGDRGDDRQRMAAHAGERQDVGLQAGAARWIGRGERQHDGRKFGFGIGGHGRAAGCGGGVEAEDARFDTAGGRAAGGGLARIARFYSNDSAQ